MNDQVIVITGASAGIGEALAKQVFAKGARPVLVARRAEALSSVSLACGGAQTIEVRCGVVALHGSSRPELLLSARRGTAVVSCRCAA